MVIDQIKLAKKDSNRVHLYSNEKYIGTIYIDSLIKYHIKENESVDETILDEAITDSNNLKLFNLCINYIMRRLRSRKEIEEYIHKKIFSYKWDIKKVNIFEILEKLEKYKYINDENFAEAWVTTRISKGFGPQRLKMELQSKGIEKNIIENVLYNIDQNIIEEQKEKLSSKFLQKKKFKNDYDKNWKLKQYLLSKGY